MARWWRKSHTGAVLREAPPIAAAKLQASGVRRRTSAAEDASRCVATRTWAVLNKCSSAPSLP
jgi:hypothetical protein